MTEAVKTGGCHCGAVRYEVRGPLRPVVACHCRQCRRQTGHYYAATQTARDALRVIDDAGVLRWYNASPDARRGFCGTCGSALFWDPGQGDGISLLAGSLDAPTGLRLAGHIHVADKGDYYEIADGLPQYPHGGAVDLLSTKVEG